jgi:hypothetical protein
MEMLLLAQICPQLPNYDNNLICVNDLRGEWCRYEEYSLEKIGFVNEIHISL